MVINFEDLHKRVSFDYGRIICPPEVNATPIIAATSPNLSQQGFSFA